MKNLAEEQKQKIQKLREERKRSSGQLDDQEDELERQNKTIVRLYKEKDEAINEVILLRQKSSDQKD